LIDCLINNASVHVPVDAVHTGDDSAPASTNRTRAGLAAAAEAAAGRGESGLAGEQEQRRRDPAAEGRRPPVHAVRPVVPDEGLRSPPAKYMHKKSRIS
jgi:hypothetical protein